MGGVHARQRSDLPHGDEAVCGDGPARNQQRRDVRSVSERRARTQSRAAAANGARRRRRSGLGRSVLFARTLSGHRGSRASWNVQGYCASRRWWRWDLPKATCSRTTATIYIVGLWGTAPYSIHTNFPVNSIADLKGKTIRASSKNESAALRAFGAVPIGMPVTEIPEAISRGTISGTTSHLSPFFDFGLDRVTNNHFFIGLGVVPLAVLMNKKKFDALPEASRAAIERNAGDTITKVWINSISRLQRGQSREAEEQPEEQGRLSVTGSARRSTKAARAGPRGMGGGKPAAQGVEGCTGRRTCEGSGRAKGVRQLAASGARRPKRHGRSFSQLVESQRLPARPCAMPAFSVHDRASGWRDKLERSR